MYNSRSLACLAQTWLFIVSFWFLLFFSCLFHTGVRRSFDHCCCHSLLFFRWVFVFLLSSSAVVACETLILKKLCALLFQLSIGPASFYTILWAWRLMMNVSSFLVAGRCFSCSSNHCSFSRQIMRFHWHLESSLLFVLQVHLDIVSNALMDHTSILDYLVYFRIFSNRWFSMNLS